MTSQYETDLKSYREQLRQFLEALAKLESSNKLSYWKQQIAGTLIAYPAGELEDLHKSFYGAQESPSPRSKALTAYWLFRLLSGEDLSTVEEVSTLYLALQQTGRMIPSNNRDSILIAGNDVTVIAQAIVKVNYLLFLLENHHDIQLFVKENKKEVTQNFKNLMKLNITWLKKQVETIKATLELCPQLPLVRHDPPVRHDLAWDVAPADLRFIDNWEQFWNFYRSMPTPFAADSVLLYRSPVTHQNFFIRAFFWLLYWSYFPHCWGIFKKEIWRPIKQVCADLRGYLFNDYTSVKALSLAIRLPIHFLLLLYSPYISLLFCYGIFTLPIKLVEVGMKHAEIRLPWQDYLTTPKKIFHMGLLTLFSFLLIITLPYLLIPTLFPLVFLVPEVMIAAFVGIYAFGFLLGAARCAIALAKEIINDIKNIYYRFRPQPERMVTFQNQYVARHSLQEPPNFLEIFGAAAHHQAQPFPDEMLRAFNPFFDLHRIQNRMQNPSFAHPARRGPELNDFELAWRFRPY